MIEKVFSSEKQVNFCSKKTAEKSSGETHLLPNNAKTRAEQKFQKVSSAFLDYPVKGLQGSKNSNFYEFLTMGIVPYLAGSAMFMVVFNAINKTIGKEPSLKGKKFALGVVLYGLMKTFTKNLVTKPVALSTGVDIELPYENVVYSLPEEAGENAKIDIQYQQRKVYDSREFFRKDLLDKEYFDKVAKKLGLGDNLNDSVTEVTPIIQNIVSTTTTARDISSYLWAGVGVGLAVQNCWNDFFNIFSARKPFVYDRNSSFIQNTGKWFANKGKNTLDITKSFCKNLLKSCKTLWTGENTAKGFVRHSGKGLIGLAALTTIGLTANSIMRAKSIARAHNIQAIDKTKESTVI